MYPGGHNMNEVPASAVAAGVPLVMETPDGVHQVDLWYAANAKSCIARPMPRGSSTDARAAAS